jgi:regulator of sirC expression with transglutaminase-like and TPR domain
MVQISEIIRDDFNAQYVYDELENLASMAREEISEARPQEWQLEKLISLFYGEWGFGDKRGVYRLSDALWLDQVLKQRQGSAVSLGAIFLCRSGRAFPRGLLLGQLFHHAGAGAERPLGQNRGYGGELRS